MKNMAKLELKFPRQDMRVLKKEIQTLFCLLRSMRGSEGERTHTRWRGNASVNAADETSFQSKNGKFKTNISDCLNCFFRFVFSFTDCLYRLSKSFVYLWEGNKKQRLALLPPSSASFHNVYFSDRNTHTFTHSGGQKLSLLQKE